MLSVVGKIYAGTLVRKVTEGLIDNEHGSLRAGRGCVDQIFTVKHIEKMQCVCGFIDLEKAYDKVNKEALWKALRM